jgi:RNA polymerase sigma-70 factor (ECF subfamily)
MSEPPIDLERVRRFVAGDAAAFEEIVGAYQGRIVTLCRYLLGNAADADDAAQDVFVKAFKNVHKFRPEAALYTWLYRIAVNTCIDRRRKPFFLSLFTSSDAAEGREAAYPDLRSEDPSPAQLVEAQQISREIQRALARLSPKLRAAIVLKEIEGLRYEEIAAVLEISLGTVKSRISRAREELQQALAGLREQNGRHAV